MVVLNFLNPVLKLSCYVVNALFVCFCLYVQRSRAVNALFVCFYLYVQMSQASVFQSLFVTFANVLSAYCNVIDLH